MNRTLHGLAAIAAPTLRRLRGRTPHGDAGTTLMELIVGMAIMVVFMGMFTSAMLLMSNTANKVEALSNTSAQATNAFLRLDKEIRYATAVSTPAFDTATGDWHVEFDSQPVTRTTTTATTVDTCTQLRIDVTKQQLQQRTWTVTGTTYSTPAAWQPLASNVTNGSAAATAANTPFPTVAKSGNATSGFQQLAMTVETSLTSPTTAVTTNRYTFTALNSSTSNTASVCQQYAVGAIG